jgi:quercetin dioxygenase-like cupin family protein
MREHEVGARWIGAVAVAATVLAAPAARAQDEPPGFVQILRSEIKWVPHPAVRGAQIAVLLGDPAKAGPFVIRVRLPPNAHIMPHRHPEARTYTVLAGEWKLGFGAKYTAAALRSFPPGSLYRLPADVVHFQAAGPSETVVQIDAVGPSTTDFVDPSDDPRKR